MIKHVVFVTDSQISIDLLTQTYTSHKYVALSLVAIDLLGLLGEDSPDLCAEIAGLFDAADCMITGHRLSRAT
eukprot:COSAG01_NODE_29748_length_630_cov_1.517891_1_plen_73_part_00